MTLKTWDAPKKWKYLFTAAYCIDYICLGLAAGLVGPTLPAISENIGIVGKEAGIIFTFRAIGWMLGSFLSAKLFEKHGGWKYLWFSLFMSSVCCCILPFIRSYWALLFFMMFAAFILSWTEVGVAVYITKVWQKDVNPYMQLLHFSFGVGASSGPFIAGLIYKIVPWHQRLMWAWITMGLLLLIGQIPQLLLKEPGPEAWNEEEDATESDEAKPETQAPSKKQSWIFVSLASAFLLLYVGAESGYGGWVSTFGYAQYKLEEGVAAWLSSVFWAAITVGRLSGVYIATIASPWTMLWGDMIGTLIGILLLIFFPGNTVVLWVATVTVGLSMATMFATAYALPIQMNIPLTSKAATLLTVGGCIGDMAVPAAVGLAMAGLGNGVFVFAVGCAFLPTLPLAVVLWVMGRKKLSKSDSPSKGEEEVGLVEMTEK